MKTSNHKSTLKGNVKIYFWCKISEKYTKKKDETL